MFLGMGAAIVGALAGVANVAGASSRARPADQIHTFGDLTLEAASDPWQLIVRAPNGEVLWQESLDQTLSYRTNDGQVFRARRMASSAGIGGGAIQMVAETDDPLGGSIAVELRPIGTRAFRMTLTPDTQRTVVSVGGAIDAAAEERFVGFGERFDAVDQRGRVVDVWAEERRVANYGTTTYAPVPLLMSSRGYSITLERFERSRFDLAVEKGDRWSWQQDAPAASMVVSYGPSLKELVRRNAELSGVPPLPPRWSFGVCKTAVGGTDAVIAEMRRLRDLKVPVSSVFSFDAVDSDANLGWPIVTFAGREAGQYPDPAAYTAALHALGYKVLNYMTADFHTDRANYNEPASHGFLVRRPDGRVYVHDGFQVAWLDLADPDAVMWWAAAWRRAMADLGYDGGMLDLGELIPTDSVLGDGTPGVQGHNRYPLLYAQAAWQNAQAIRPDGDFTLLVRSGALGAQRYQSAQWNGDAVMRWEGPDGLRSQIPAGLSFGLSGFPYWHTEVAGYVQADLNPTQERELWLRWLQMATWTSMLRDHLGDYPRGGTNVWSDQATLEAFRQAARVHSSLVPYLHGLALEATQTGLPLLRFMALEVPEDPRAWQQDQAYFLGPSFLVAPVVEAGAVSRTVYLPAGEWVDYWSGTVLQGGTEVTVPAPLDGSGPPVFVRAGALIPLAPDYDTLNRSTDPTIRTYNEDLIVRIMPGSAATAPSFTLADGTFLSWNGSALTLERNPVSRTIELRLPDGTNVQQQVAPGSATVTAS
jgi:alpha-D-xyloside xylohydrolase